MIMLRLAERFRRPDVNAFLASVSSAQITEWIMYYKVKSDDAENRRTRDTLKRNVRKKRGR